MDEEVKDTSQEDPEGSNTRGFPQILKRLGLAVMVGYVVFLSVEEMILWVGWAMSTRHFSIHMSNTTEAGAL